ncbi:hypothetical protein [uncultured Fibrobacter sp.]|uniref:hypothetical protein n=1 Tax=uncultured Fibrobacter sp. TaxID=261512 RepID=UPI0028049878|nr:hypothetical protein [uncultured Fibrobacter sp.]
MRKTWILLPILLSICLWGCSSRPVSFGSYDQIQGRDFVRLPACETSASSFALFDVIPIGATSRERKIKRRLLEQCGGDDLIDIKISSKHTWAVIGVINTLTVSATPIKFNDAKGTRPAASESSINEYPEF